MKKVILATAVLLFVVHMSAQIPSTDIYVADVVQRGDEFRLTSIKNITAREGYDNQPYFINDNEFYFSSIRDGKQADIYKYDLKKKNTEQLTQTPESEYSPTPVFGSNSFSVVRVEADSAQHLYRFLPDGTNPVILYTGSDLIGYHHWVDQNRVLVYTLEDNYNIRLLNLAEQKNIEVSENGGRCLQKIPGENSVSFTFKTDTLQWQIKKFMGTINKVETVVNLPAGAEDYAWYNSSIIVTGIKGKLYYFNLNKKEKGWQLFSDLSNTSASGFYRIAFDPTGKKIALVVKH